MIKALKQFFDENLSQAPNERPGPHDLQIAAAALLFEISRSDERTNMQERDKIAELVKRQFELSEGEATVLLDLAEQEAHDSTSLHGFVTLINSDWTEKQRLQLVEYMWQIAYLDDQLDDHEVHLMRKIQRLLYIPHKKFIGAKIRARDGR